MPRTARKSASASSEAADRVLSVSQDWSPELQKAKVYEQILLDIILGELAPNARLDEQGLARRYGAGLAGVRDALGRLALEGLVVRRPRAGTTVSPLDLVELRQALEVRALLEPQCAALAAAYATEEDLKAVQGAFDGAEEAVRTNDCRALVAMDQRFHAAVARASRNAVMAKVLVPLQHKAARFWVYSMGSDTEAERLDEIGRHRAIAGCIARRDADAARKAMIGILNASPGTLARLVASTKA